MNCNNDHENKTVQMAPGVRVSVKSLKKMVSAVELDIRKANTGPLKTDLQSLKTWLTSKQAA